MISTIFNMFFSDLSYNVSGVFADAHSAIEFCKTNRPDAVMMDIHLGGKIDGIEASKSIAGELNIPVLFLSSDSKSDTFQRINKTQAYTYMQKPVYKSLLAVAIELAMLQSEFSSDENSGNFISNLILENFSEPCAIVNENQELILNSAAKVLLGEASDNPLTLSGFVAKLEDQKAENIIQISKTIEKVPIFAGLVYARFLNAMDQPEKCIVLAGIKNIPNHKLLLIKEE